MARKDDGERPKANDRTANPAERTVRRLWPVPLGGVLAMATLLVLTPIVAASGVASLTAPYTAGVAIHHQDPVRQGCGATLAVSHTASFNLSTGVGTGAARAKSTPCTTADSQATYDAIVGVRGLTFTASRTGTFSTTAAWSITWNASASMTSKAAAAGAQSTVEIWLLVKLTDASTGKVVAKATHFVVQKDLGAAATFTSAAVAGTYSATVPAALTGGHSYRIYAVMGFDIAAVVAQGSPAGAVVTATVDLGSAGHGGTLTSITVA